VITEYVFIYHGSCINTCLLFPGPNIAFGKIAEQGPETLETSTADKAVDGDTSDAASSGACAQTVNSSHSWWKVDLGRPYLLTGIKIFTSEGGGTFVCCFKAKLWCFLFIEKVFNEISQF